MERRVLINLIPGRVEEGHNHRVPIRGPPVCLLINPPPPLTKRVYPCRASVHRYRRYTSRAIQCRKERKPKCHRLVHTHTHTLHTLYTLSTHTNTTPHTGALYTYTIQTPRGVAYLHLCCDTTFGNMRFMIRINITSSSLCVFMCVCVGGEDLIKY